MCNRRTIELMNVKGGHESSLAGEILCAARGRCGGGGAGVLVEGDVPVPAINRKKWISTGSCVNVLRHAACEAS